MLFRSAINTQYANDMIAKLDEFNNMTDKSQIYWLIGSAHRSAYWETVMLQQIHEKFGDIGLDNLWMPSLDEMYEYWFMRNNTMTSKIITDTGIKFKMYVPKMPNFFYRDLSVLLSGIDSKEGVTVTSSNNVYGTSYNINENNKLLVNLNFDEKLMQRVNKHVEAFEADYNADYLYDNAYYFVQQLKEGLKEGYLARINKFTSPPVLASMVINS